MTSKIILKYSFPIIIDDLVIRRHPRHTGESRYPFSIILDSGSGLPRTGYGVRNDKKVNSIMQIQKVFSIYKKDLQEVEKYLSRYITSDVKLIPEVSHHLIGSGGKRFRPLLLLISAALCGCKGKNRFPTAAVMEFIHTATLLHDDVIDQAIMRRGKTSANNIWGNAASVLVGDFLYSKSFTLMTEIGNMQILKMMSDVTNVMSEG